MLVTLRDDLLQPIARAKPTSAARPRRRHRRGKGQTRTALRAVNNLKI